MDRLGGSPHPSCGTLGSMTSDPRTAAARHAGILIEIISEPLACFASKYGERLGGIAKRILGQPSQHSGERILSRAVFKVINHKTRKAEQ